MVASNGKVRVRSLGEVLSIMVALVVSALVAVGLLAACDSGTPPTPTPVSGQARGEQIYMNYCQVCHPGGYLGAGPPIRPVIPTSTNEQLTGIIRHGKNRMPGFGPKDITDADLALLIEYMRKW